MYLQKLEINGFKSFARKTTLEFKKGITSVVGPNGSGKSNIAESVRWVMGEQSIKSLRGKHSTDVIFSGSDKSARLGLAEVSLTFNNSDRQAPLDYTEVVLTRRIHRDGHSDYLLNNQPARLQDVLLLLAQINLSSKTYSVIGQGMVDEILSVTPRERKDFFEEASGVKPLQIKKNEAVRKLEHTSENLETVNIQLNEISPRLRSLTRQVKRLDRRVEIENELSDLQYHYYGESFFELLNKKKALNSQTESQQKNIESLETQVKNLQDTMFSLTKESTHSDKFTSSQKEYQKLIDEKSKHKEEELQIKGELLQVAKSSQKTHVPISVVREVEIKHETLVEKFRSHHLKASRHQELTDWQDWHKDFEKIIDDQENLLNPLKPYLQEVDLSDKEQKLKEIHKQVVTIESGLEQVQKNIKNLAEQEKQEKSKIWQTQNELQDYQKKLNDLVNQRNEVRVDLARVEAHLGDLEADVVEERGNEFLIRVQKWAPSKEHSYDTGQIKETIHKLKHELELIGGIDPEVQKEYTEIKERFDFLTTQTEDLQGGIDKLNEAIVELDETIHKQFSESFKRINEEFQKYFRILFRGGKAELKLVKASDDINDKEEALISEADDDTKKTRKKIVKDEIIGVDITATPPGKKLKSITMLSGGERALTSIGLISAIISNNPAPFVVLDEVDAALDEQNSVRFAEIVSELSHKTQFVIITHNRATMEHADLLYGVTMGDDGISKLISLKLEDSEEYTNR